MKSALDHLHRTASQRTVVFLISDFQDAGFEKTLRITRRKHDVIPVMVNDQRELDLPNVGLLRLRDPESGSMVTVDTASRRHREAFRKLQVTEAEKRDAIFRRLKLNPIRLATGEDYVDPLKRFFHRREAER